MEKKVIKVLVCKTMREVVDKINDFGLLKDDIIQVIKDDSLWFVLYQD